ncbi:MAG: response regulator [Alphaproteobacteria bacterium]
MMSSPSRILIVEDDPQMLRFLRTSLAVHNYAVAESTTGRGGLAMVSSGAPDVILLDLGLPDMDGTDLVGQVRAVSSTPIIIISCRDTVADKIAALDHGADDYVSKPFDMGELLARIRSALRRGTAKGVGSVFRSGDLEVDLIRREVKSGSGTVRLSPREVDVLRLLVTHADKVVTHQTILKEVWGGAQIDNTHYLRIFIGRLRQKIEPDPARPRHILTESGVGYRLKLHGQREPED